MAKLTETQVHQTVTIEAITNPEFYESVSNHGFVIGSDVRVISKVPGAIACEINQSRFAIRTTDADSVIVSN